MQQRSLVDELRVAYFLVKNVFGALDPGPQGQYSARLLDQAMGLIKEAAEHLPQQNTSCPECEKVKKKLEEAISLLVR